MKTYQQMNHPLGYTNGKQNYSEQEVIDLITLIDSCFTTVEIAPCPFPAQRKWQEWWTRRARELVPQIPADY